MNNGNKKKKGKANERSLDIGKEKMEKKKIQNGAPGPEATEACCRTDVGNLAVPWWKSHPPIDAAPFASVPAPAARRNQPPPPFSPHPRLPCLVVTVWGAEDAGFTQGPRRMIGSIRMIRGCRNNMPAFWHARGEEAEDGGVCVLLAPVDIAGSD